jgi:hypothetical protein
MSAPVVDVVVVDVVVVGCSGDDASVMDGVDRRVV